MRPGMECLYVMATCITRENIKRVIDNVNTFSVLLAPEIYCIKAVWSYLIPLLFMNGWGGGRWKWRQKEGEERKKIMTNLRLNNEKRISS